MLVCDNPSFFYLPGVKTASHTIWKVLSGFYKIRGEGQKHAMYYVPGMESSLVFVSVRCPYSRLVSLYRWLSTKAPDPCWTGLRWEKRRRAVRMDLHTFLTDPWMREHAVRPWCPRLNGIPVQHLVRFEHLAEDLRQLPILQGKKFQLPHLHKGRYDEPWYAVYLNNPGLAEDIHARCKPDFEAFGYSSELETYLPQSFAKEKRI